MSPDGLGASNGVCQCSGASTAHTPQRREVDPATSWTWRSTSRASGRQAGPNSRELFRVYLDKWDEIRKVCLTEIQGALLDGRSGICCLCQTGENLEVLGLRMGVGDPGACSLRELQVVCGGFVYITMFLSALNEVWGLAIGWQPLQPHVHQKLPGDVLLDYIPAMKSVLPAGGRIDTGTLLTSTNLSTVFIMPSRNAE